MSAVHNISGAQRLHSRKGMVALNTAVRPEHKAIIARTAAQFDISQTAALALIFEHIELTAGGLPQWAEDEEGSALFK
jgi:hypothetical protein